MEDLCLELFFLHAVSEKASIIRSSKLLQENTVRMFVFLQLKEIDSLLNLRTTVTHCFSNGKEKSLLKTHENG
jgi:hypothetical protein